MLKDKVAIVTGGAGGIGSSTVRKFVREGAKVVVADIRQEDAQRIVDEMDSEGFAGKTIAVKTDVSSYNDVLALVSKAVENFGQLDVMFNNAGIGTGVPLLEHEPSTNYEPIIAINQNGVYYGILAAAKQFVRQGTGGVIINTSSIYGYSAADMAFTYSASKAAVISFTRSAALELAEHNIRVVAVAPGRVRTPILEQFGEELNRLFASEQLRGKLTEPDEIADVVAFLASEQANAVNGTVVNIEDGYSIFKNRLPKG